jgi:hypothetical protein
MLNPEESEAGNCHPTYRRVAPESFFLFDRCCLSDASPVKEETEEAVVAVSCAAAGEQRNR